MFSYLLLATFLAATSAQRAGPQGYFPAAQPADRDRYIDEALPRYEDNKPQNNRNYAPQPQSQPPAREVGNFNCPEKFGFYPHSRSCDKYWACENGTASLKLCGNGLVFDDSTPSDQENCAYPFSVKCNSRTDLEPPISTPNCPNLYGIFPANNNCRTFYSCWNGEASKYECPPGLAYDVEERVCVWADRVERCDDLEVAEGFVCPADEEQEQAGHYTRHAHPTDCRKFYVCIESQPRPYGCSFGTVFNIDTLQCDDPEAVVGCEKYYGDIDVKTIKKIQSGRN